MRGRLKDDFPSVLANGDPAKVRFRDICRAAEEGDRLAVRALEEAAEYLAIAIGNAIDHFDPEMVLLSGGAFAGSDYLYQQILRHEPKGSFWQSAGDVKIERSRLGEDCEVIGAAALILKDFFAAGGNP